MHQLSPAEAMFYITLLAMIIAGLKLDDDMLARKFARNLAQSRAARRR